ncbi:MAG: pilus assembly protein PilM, partial [Oligoflexia bacterium]|nr:pilus assembly protein PilM [Oligoflexia bacterium]
MFWKKKLLAIDLGHRAFKGVQLLKENGEIILGKYFYYDLIEKLQSVAVVDEELKIALDVHDLKREKTLLALNNRLVTSIELDDFPDLPEDEIRSAVEFELEQNRGIKVEGVVFDYYYIEGKKKRLKIIYVDRLLVEKQLQILENLQFVPMGVDLEIYAIDSALAYSGYLANQEGNYIIVDMGEALTTVGLHRKNQLVDFKTSELALNSITNALSTQFSFSASECE